MAGPALACGPVPEKVTNFAKMGSEVEELAVLGSTLFFASRDPVTGTGLWKAEPVNNGVVPTRLRSWAAGTSISRIIAASDVVYFILNESVRYSLWTTDGTVANTQQIAVFDVIFDTQSPNDFAVLGRTLFFSANTGGMGFELWKSDGTVAGTQLVKDIQPGANDSFPQELTVLGNTLFFRADDGPTAHGAELWKSDGTMAGTQLVQDIRTGGNSNPSSLRVMNGKLFFTAASGGQAEIWSSDGTNTQRVVSSVVLGTNHSALEELTVVGNTLFFHMDDRRGLGDELWRSDGTEGGTRMVADLQEGSGDSAPKSLVAVGGTLFFMANDGHSGRELWKTEELGTGVQLVKDFYPRVGDAPEEAILALGPGALLVSANNDVNGQELWKVNRGGAEQLTDIISGSVGSSPRDMTIAGGRLFFSAAYKDEGRELVAIPLNKVDCLPPQITCPGDLPVEAISPGGTWLFIPAPKQLSEDDSLTPLTVTYFPAPRPYPFTLGRTHVEITVSDAALNSVKCPFDVIVDDTIPPTLVCPRQLVQEAAGPGGTSVSFPVKAVDAVTASPTVVFSRPSGSVFQLGQEEQITATATDARGNSSTCRFTAAVKDTVPPRISCPQPVVRVAMSAEPVPITYPPPVVEDTVGVKEVLTDHASGGLFNVGVTNVTLTAVDTSNNTASCTFSVYNQDTIAPSITCPGPQQVVATGDEGAAVLFPDATAEDQFGPPTVSYSQEPGSTFPVGETIVTATARDLGGNEVSCTFPVTVLEKPAGCGCQSGSAGASIFWLVLALMPLWARRRAARLAR